MLSTWAPNHHFFAKKFVHQAPQQAKAKSKLTDKLEVSKPEFFYGLPNKLGKKRKGRSVIKPTR